MKKKMLALLSAAVLTVSLAACGGNSASSQASAPASSAPAAAGYPTKNISVVVPFNAGSNTDTQMRLFQPYLEKALGPTLVVNNNGASGTIGTTAFLEAPADGYTVLFSLPTPTVYKPVTGETAYAAEDLTPAASLSAAALYLVVRNDSAYTTGADLIDYIKANPGAYTYANAGNGGIAHLAFATFLSGEGLEAVSVPFTGGTADCYTAVMGGHVESYVCGEQDLAGRDDVRPLINLGTKSEAYPDVPTLADLGYDGYGIDNFSAFYFRSDVPAELVDAFAAAVETAVNDPAFVSAAAGAGLELSYKRGSELSDMIGATVQSITPVMDTMGLISK